MTLASMRGFLAAAFGAAAAAWLDAKVAPWQKAIAGADELIDTTIAEA